MKKKSEKGVKDRKRKNQDIIIQEATKYKD